MKTIEYQRVEVELTHEETDILINAYNLLSDFINLMEEKQLDEVWYHTYDGEEMMRGEQVVAAYATLDHLLNVREIM